MLRSSNELADFAAAKGVLQPINVVGLHRRAGTPGRGCQDHHTPRPASVTRLVRLGPWGPGLE